MGKPGIGAPSPVYDAPLLKFGTPTPLMELEERVRAFPTANKDIEGFFAERADHRAGRYEEWANDDRKLHLAAPDLYDNTGNIINRPGDSS